MIQMLNLNSIFYVSHIHLLKSYLNSFFLLFCLIIQLTHFFSHLVKPIINISWNQKELPTTLTVIENTFETIHCVISANPSAITNIEWFKNDQLIRGKSSCETHLLFFLKCIYVEHLCSY